MHTLLTVVGARPQFIKAAVLRRLFEASEDFHEVLVHTGQHYDDNMSKIFFDELGMRPPEHSFNQDKRTHGAMTGQMLEQIEGVLMDLKPSACLVYGDTDSTLAGALAAAKLHIPVFHVEAGLRSFNKAMPEELNRIVTDHLSDLLFCSTDVSVKNLEIEGITDGVHSVGDIMFDAVKHFQVEYADMPLDLGTGNGKPIAACTIHRAENTDDPKRMAAIFEMIREMTQTYDVILPLHPRTANAIKALNINLGEIRTVTPLGYNAMQRLLAASEMVLTDSGGLQKEAFFHRVPCITLRDETEWIELIENGWNRLWTTPDYKARKPITEYGEGDTGQKILELIRNHLNMADAK
jgi:UDP-GlcNAc3NAcA epimerase